MPYNKLLISAFFVLPITFAHFPFGGIFGGFGQNNSENRTFPCRGRGRGHWNRTGIFPPQGTNNTNSSFGFPAGNRRGNTEFGFRAGNGRFGGFGTTGNGSSTENQQKQNNSPRSRRWASTGGGEERQDLLRLISLIIQNGVNGTGAYGNITEALARIGLLPANNKNGNGHRFPRHAGRRLQNGTRKTSNSDSDENEGQQFGRNVNSGFGRGDGLANSGFGNGGSANSGFGRGGAANSGFGRGGGLANSGFGNGGSANSGFGRGGAANSGFGNGGSASSGFGRGGRANSGFGRGDSVNSWPSNGGGRNKEGICEFGTR